MADLKKCAADLHAWIVWDDGMKPVAEDVTREEAEALIEENKDERYAECSECGKTINA